MKTTQLTFLSCHWENLVYLNYYVDPEIINQYLPKDVELDLLDGKAVLSFVCFEFSHAKFFGIKIPFHQHFPEINLRTYVKSKTDDSKKGIYFLSEMVPKIMTYCVAKYLFGEPFSLRKLGLQRLTNQLTYHINDQDCQLEINVKHSVSNNQNLNTEEQFVIERELAFCGKSGQLSKIFQVKHQQWNLIPLYNATFMIQKLGHIHYKLEKLLVGKIPDSIFMTDGSKVDVSAF